MSWLSQGINDVTQGLGKAGQAVGNVAGQIGQGASGLGNGISSVYNNNKRWFDPLASTAAGAFLGGPLGFASSMFGAGIGNQLGGGHLLHNLLGEQTFHALNPGSLSMHNKYLFSNPSALGRIPLYAGAAFTSPLLTALNTGLYNSYKKHDSQMKARERYGAMQTSNFDQSMAGANGVQGSVVNAKTGQDVQNTILGYEQQRQAAQNAYMQSMLSQISGFANIAGMGLGAGV